MPVLSPTPCFSVTYGKEKSNSEKLPQLGLLRVESSESFNIDDTEEHPETYECPI